MPENASQAKRKTQQIQQSELEQRPQEKMTLDQAAGAVRREFADKMKKEFEFEVVGSGGGGQNGIDLLSLHFESKKIFNLDEARPIVVKCTNEFLDLINKDEKIKPFLKNYPFTKNNILLMFSFLNNLKYPDQGKIAYIFIKNGKIDYATYNHQTKHLQDCHEETFEEAMQKGELCP